MIKKILTYTFLLVSLFSLAQQNESTLFFKDCTAETFKENLEALADSSILIDARAKRDYKRSRIKGAILGEEINSIFNIVKNYPKNKPIFVYSESGDESLTVSALLMRKGYSKIYNLKNGLDDWWRAGFKLDKSKVKIGIVSL